MVSVSIIQTEATYSSDHDGRISEIVELVHAGDDDRPEEAEYPCPESVDGHGRVVKVGDGGAHLWIGRIILCSRGKWTALVRFRGSRHTETGTYRAR